VRTWSRQSDRAERDAAIRRAADEANARHSIIDVALAIGAPKLERAGQSARKSLCIFHNEKTPSLHFYPGANNYHCYGCGANGDSIRLVMDAKGLGFLDTLQYLGSFDLPIFDPAERAKMIEVETVERLRAIADARRFFALADPVTADDPGGRYLAARGIRLPEYAGTVRFSMIPSWQDPETGEWGRKLRPALICGCQDELGVFTAIQRIFVDGPEPGKAACKLSLGCLKGAALRLGPVRSEITTTEGPEDGLHLAQDMPERSVWVPCGTGLWPFLRFPGEVTSVILAGQNDAPGRAAVTKADAAFLEAGLAVATVYPDSRFKDWDNMARGILA
jgi:DNA primase